MTASTGMLLSVVVRSALLTSIYIHMYLNEWAAIARLHLH